MFAVGSWSEAAARRHGLRERERRLDGQLDGLRLHRAEDERLADAVGDDRDRHAGPAQPFVRFEKLRDPAREVLDAQPGDLHDPRAREHGPALARDADLARQVLTAEHRYRDRVAWRDPVDLAGRLRVRAAGDRQPQEHEPRESEEAGERGARPCRASHELVPSRERRNHR